MQQFNDALKARAVAPLVGLRAMSANASAEEVGVSQESLSRRLHAARSVGGKTTSSKKPWIGAEKLRPVNEASGLTGSAVPWIDPMPRDHHLPHIEQQVKAQGRRRELLKEDEPT